jgi:putative exporter of polyketide antibiotics
VSINPIIQFNPLLLVTEPRTRVSMFANLIGVWILLRMITTESGNLLKWTEPPEWLTESGTL